MDRLVLFTIISYPLSITLHHGLIILCALIGIGTILRSLPKPFMGNLGTPINLLNTGTVASAIVFMQEKIKTALSSSFLNYSYLYTINTKPAYKLLHNISLVLVIEGVLILPVFLYNLMVNNKFKLLWGGLFKVAEIYSLFTLAAITLALYKRSIAYSLLAIVFLGVVIIPARRAELLGLLLAVSIAFFILSLNDRKTLKVACAVFLSLLLVSVGSFYYFAEIKKERRFVMLRDILSGKRPITESTIDFLTSARWQNLKAGLVVIGRDFKELNFVPLLIGHGINSGRKLEPPVPNGLTYYESIFIVQEFIQRGAVGLAGILLIFIRSLKVAFSFRFRNKEDILLLPFIYFLVYYNLSTIFTPYVNATLPLALFMFGIAEAYIKRSQVQKR